MLDIPTLANQLVHHAAHACGKGDVYFGIYPMAEMVRDGGDFNAINLGGQGAGRYAIGPSYLDGPDGWDGPPYNGMLGFYAHEVGHTLDLRHAPCGDTVFNAPEYPYPNGGLGGARSWHPWFEEFVDRDSAYSDLMSYCCPQTVSAPRRVRCPRPPRHPRAPGTRGCCRCSTTAVANSTGSAGRWRRTMGTATSHRVGTSGAPGFPYAATHDATLLLRDDSGAIRMQRSVGAVR